MPRSSSAKQWISVSSWAVGARVSLRRMVVRCGSAEESAVKAKKAGARS
jgi:hypothetical protein